MQEKYYRAIKTSYSNYRYTATVKDGKRVTMLADDTYRPEENHRMVAEKLCAAMDWPGEIAGGVIKDGVMVWVFTS